MKPVASFIVNARQKAKYVAKAVAGALAQTVPCEIVLSDQGSTDGTFEVMRDTVDAIGSTRHQVQLVRCPIETPYGMVGSNTHFTWCVAQTSLPYIFQCSADDYSLPDRVAVCMEAVEKNPCAVVATHQYFEVPEKGRIGATGFPIQSGYIKAGEGLSKLTYGSCIAGYSREFLAKMEGGGRHTIDVLLGYLGALDGGYYVVANPQHVHVDVADIANAGFQGKLAGSVGDEHMRLCELNHLQLMDLYFECLERAQKAHPEGIANDDLMPVLNMILGQAKALSAAREALRVAGITPGNL